MNNKNRNFQDILEVTFSLQTSCLLYLIIIQHTSEDRIYRELQSQEFDIPIEKNGPDMRDMTGPVTIYKNNQLGISINVEEHGEQEDNFEDEVPGGKFAKHLRRLTSKDAETVSLVNSAEIDTSSSTLSGKKRRQQMGRTQIIKGRIYLFLEHPTGLKCFVYHMGV